MQVRGFDKKGDILTLSIMFEVGSITDALEKKYGISHFVEHLILRRAMTVDFIFEKFAGSIGGGTSRNHTEYRATFHKRHYEEIIELFLGIFKNYKDNISVEDMRQEIKIIKSEQYKRNPGLNDFVMLMYDSSEILVPRENIYSGELDKLSLDDIFYWINKYYCYENVSIYMTGDDIRYYMSDVSRRLKSFLPTGERNKINLKLPFENFKGKWKMFRQQKDYPHSVRLHLIYEIPSNVSMRDIYIFRIICQEMLVKHVREFLNVYNINCLFSSLDYEDRFISICVDTADNLGFKKIFKVLKENIMNEIENNLEMHIESLEIDFCESKGLTKDIIMYSAEGIYSRFPDIEVDDRLRDRLKSIMHDDPCVLEITNKKREIEKYRISYISRMKQLKEIYS